MESRQNFESRLIEDRLKEWRVWLQNSYSIDKDYWRGFVDALSLCIEDLEVTMQKKEEEQQEERSWREIESILKRKQRRWT